MKKFPVLTILTVAMIFADASFAAPRPMKARQKSLDLEFKVYRTKDMPPNWFKTYDNFYVTKRIDNNWIYGRRTIHGMERTNIIVGTVDPYMVPELNEQIKYPAPGEIPVYVPPLPPEMEEKPQNDSADVQPTETQAEQKPSEPPAAKEESETPEPDTNRKQKKRSVPKRTGRNDSNDIPLQLITE